MINRSDRYVAHRDVCKPTLTEIGLIVALIFDGARVAGESEVKWVSENQEILVFTRSFTAVIDKPTTLVTSASVDWPHLSHTGLQRIERQNAIVEHSPMLVVESVSLVPGCAMLPAYRQ